MEIHPNQEKGQSEHVLDPRIGVVNERIKRDRETKFRLMDFSRRPFSRFPGIVIAIDSAPSFAPVTGILIGIESATGCVIGPSIATCDQEIGTATCPWIGTCLSIDPVTAIVTWIASPPALLCCSESDCVIGRCSVSETWIETGTWTATWTEIWTESVIVGPCSWIAICCDWNYGAIGIVIATCCDYDCPFRVFDSCPPTIGSGVRADQLHPIFPVHFSCQKRMQSPRCPCFVRVYVRRHTSLLPPVA